MDLAFTKEEMTFREEVRAFFQDNVPPETRRKLVEGRHLSKDEMVTWWRILNKKGWGCSHWPKEYGGTGWMHLQLFAEDVMLHRGPAGAAIFLRPVRAAPALLVQDAPPGDHLVLGEMTALDHQIGKPS